MKNTKLFKICILVLSGSFSLPSIADTHLIPDIDAGKTIANKGVEGVAPCLSCHGANGEGFASANFPRLAGSSEYYLSKQLHDFSSGARMQVVMQPIAKSLNEQQIADVAAYYSSLPLPVRPVNPNESDDILAAGEKKAGEQLAEIGDIERQLVACANCHGPRGVGLPPAIPTLLGQSSGYIAAQLLAWQKGDRKNDGGGLMQAVAENLTEADIKAVAAYYSTVRPEQD